MLNKNSTTTKFHVVHRPKNGGAQTAQYIDTHTSTSTRRWGFLILVLLFLFAFIEAVQSCFLLILAHSRPQLSFGSNGMENEICANALSLNCCSTIHCGNFFLYTYIHYIYVNTYPNARAIQHIVSSSHPFDKKYSFRKWRHVQCLCVTIENFVVELAIIRIYFHLDESKRGSERKEEND